MWFDSCVSVIVPVLYTRVLVLCVPVVACCCEIVLFDGTCLVFVGVLSVCEHLMLIG